MSDRHVLCWALIVVTFVVAGVSLAESSADTQGAYSVHLSGVYGRPAPSGTPIRTATTTPWPTLHAEVVHVADGDTIDVRYHDVTLRVRYIGVDTPKEGDPTKGAAYCYGNQAAKRNATLVADRWVDLERDVDERGSWNRHLFYVYVDGVMVNEQLVKEGYALSYAVPDNVKYAHQLAAAEATARAEGRGLWGECVAAKPTPSFPVPTEQKYGLRITYMHYVNDEESEYVRLSNMVDEAINLKDRVIESQVGGDRPFIFPELVLGPGENIYLCSGLGARARYGPPQHLLWGTGYRWRDEGDRAVLYAPDGTPVDAWPYGDWTP